MSSSSCLRIVKSQSVTIPKNIQQIGIDDWAFKKGHTYGSVIVDQKTGKAIDLLDSRDEIDVEQWLKQYPNITHITRDRGVGYIKVINKALPNAIQIADRFHLIMNYSAEYMTKI